MVAGRVVVVGRVDDDNEVRGVARAGLSMEGRVVAGRFAAVAVEAAGRVVAGLAGDALEAVLEASAVRRTEGLLFSSPDVTDERSGSVSEAEVLEANPVFRTDVPTAGRVGGLLRLEPTAPARAVEVVGTFDAVVVARAVLEEAAGLRAVPAPMTVVGRRGGTVSLDVDGALEAIFRRAEGEAGVVDVRDVFLGVPWVAVDVDSEPEASLATAGGGGVDSIAAASPAIQGRERAPYIAQYGKTVRSQCPAQAVECMCRWQENSCMASTCSSLMHRQRGGAS